MTWVTIYASNEAEALTQKPTDSWAILYSGPGDSQKAIEIARTLVKKGVWEQVKVFGGRKIFEERRSKSKKLDTRFPEKGKKL